MRVLVASNMYPGPQGPFYGTFVERQVRALRAFDDLALDVVAIDDPRKGIRSPVKYARFFADLVKKLAMSRPELVHYHYAVPTAVPAPLLRLLSRVPYVVTLHGGDFYEMPERLPLGRQLVKLLLGNAAALIVVGEAMANDVRAFMKDACPPLHVINMGVDAPAFEAARAPAPVPVTELCFVGQLIHRKGLDVLLAAMAELPSDVKLTVLGDGPARPSLEELTRVLGLRERVVFLGAQPPETVPLIVTRAGVLVVPSRREPLGIVALEGMAAGCVVVASRVGGLAELVKDGDNGYLVSADDARELGRVLREVTLASPDVLSRVREEALRTARANSVQYQASRVREVLLGGR